jgi:hypothetical protein
VKAGSVVGNDSRATIFRVLVFIAASDDWTLSVGLVTSNDSMAAELMMLVNVDEVDGSFFCVFLYAFV